jgi:hypothetical protein
LKFEYVVPLSNFPSSFNLRRYSRVFVDEDSGGILPLDLLASDLAGDVITFFITRMTGRAFQSIPFCGYTGTLRANSQNTPNKAREEDAASVCGYTGTL